MALSLPVLCALTPTRRRRYPTRRRRTTFLAGALLIPSILLSVGCSSEVVDGSSNTETTRTDPSTPAPTDSLTPAATNPATRSGLEAPTAPPEAEGQDFEAALFAASHFFEMYNYLLQSGDAPAFEDLTTGNCEFCLDTISSVRSVHGEGGWWVGGLLTFEEPWTHEEGVSAKMVNVLAEVQEQGFEAFASDGESLGSGKPRDMLVELEMVWHDGRWLVNALKADF